MSRVVMGARHECARGVCLRRFNSDMGSFKSGWRVREWMRMEKEKDLGQGFAMSAVVVSWIAVVRWFERQRRGIRRLILVNSSGVNANSLDLEFAELSSGIFDIREDRQEKETEKDSFPAASG
ncbi:hypothetical protein SLA2020_228000 [Shorea laevis]